MSNNKVLITIPGRLHSAAMDKCVAGVDEIVDDVNFNPSKRQSEFNHDVTQNLADIHDIIDHPMYVGEDNYVYIWNPATKSYNKTNSYVRGEGFKISKVFPSITAMQEYRGDDLKGGDFVIITSNVEDEDNAKLFIYSGTPGSYTFLVDMSGAIGFTGKTPQLIIDRVTTVDYDTPASASMQQDGEDSSGNPIYKLSLALPKGANSDSNYVIVNNHSGEGEDPTKIYIPSAASDKENFESLQELMKGLIDDEEVLAKALNNINDRLNNHASNDLIHLTFGYNKDDFDALIESKVTLNKLIFGKAITDDYVDLGLPSGTIWAVKNLGATKVKEDGNRYMWGDPTIRTDKADFTTTNCIYYDTTSGNIPGCLGHGYKGNVTTYMEKYLDPAYNTYNGAWHTPTKEQFDELIQAYHDAEIAYINGVKVIKLNFIGAKYICFPCTNCWYDNNDNGDAAYREEAYVMCNNIKGVFDSRCIKLSYSNNRVTVSEYTDLIYYGVAVRPVLSL